MAKRFTDTEKWKNPSFRTMDNEYRWLWLYLLDSCDAAGIWRVDFELAGFCIGHKFNSRHAAEYFEDKIIVVDHDKWFIPSFISFQYGELNEDSRPHQSVIKMLLKHGINPKTLGRLDKITPQDETDHRKIDQNLKGIDTLSIGYPKGIHTLKDKDTENDKDKEKGSAEGKNQNLSLLADSLYAKYPRKLGKKDGIKALVNRFKKGLSEAEAMSALDRFLAHHRSAGTEKTYLPYFSTWVNDLDDWLDPQTGQSESFANDKPVYDWAEITGQKLGAV